MRNAVRSVAAAALIGTAAAGASAQQGQAIQWRVEDGGNGHWYGTAEAIDWEWAIAAASAQGAHLATPTSESENTFIQQVFVASGRARGWIGLEQADDQATPDLGWRWVTGEKWAWTNWHCFGGNLGCAPDDTPCFQPPWRVEDNQANCATMQGDGRWDDLEKANWCDGQSRIALLEWSADCNNDGIVDYGQCRDGSLPDYNGNNIPDCCEAGTQCVVGSYPVQWRVEDGGNGHWYAISIVDVPMQLPQARQIALARGGELASVASQHEYGFITPLLMGAVDSEGCYPAVYQGLTQLPGEPWKWMDGTPFQWSVWGDESDPMWPQGKLALFAPGSFEPLCVPHLLWDDGPIDAIDPLHRGIFIEWSADCNGDGIVDYGQILTGQLVDSDADGVPDTCQCPGDITGNRAVDGVDLAIVLGAWGTSGQGEFRADIDRDGVVSGTDLAYVLGGWGPCQ